MQCRRNTASRLARDAAFRHVGNLYSTRPRECGTAKKFPMRINKLLSVAQTVHP